MMSILSKSYLGSYWSTRLIIQSTIHQLINYTILVWWTSGLCKYQYGRYRPIQIQLHYALRPSLAGHSVRFQISYHIILLVYMYVYTTSMGR